MLEVYLITAPLVAPWRPCEHTHGRCGATLDPPLSIERQDRGRGRGLTGRQACMKNDSQSQAT